MMLQENIVSLIAPFYNGGMYLDRFLRSVLNQTFTNIQFILINDGSTDNSDEIVKKYEEELCKKFYEFIYIYKENGGAASAVNTALKFVTGEYLCWADCDDQLCPENIEKKFLFLNANKTYGMVNCGAQAINQESNQVIGNLVIPECNRKENMFLQIINGIPVYPGVFMIRTELLFSKLKNREIYYNREAGQNYQLLLPVAYDSKCGFIEDILYVYYIRSDSHSHNVDYEKTYHRTYVREELLNNIFTFLPKEEKVKLMDEINYDSSIRRFNLSFYANDKLKNREAYKEIKNKKRGIPLKIKLKYLIINIDFLNNVYRLRG